MPQESQPIGISATRNVTCRTDTSNTTNNLQTEQVTTQPTMSDPVTAQLVNPFHNTIDLSTTEGKNYISKLHLDYLLMKNTLANQRTSSSSLNVLKHALNLNAGHGCINIVASFI